MLELDTHIGLKTCWKIVLQQRNGRHLLSDNLPVAEADVSVINEFDALDNSRPVTDGTSEKGSTFRNVSSIRIFLATS